MTNSAAGKMPTKTYPRNGESLFLTLMKQILAFSLSLIFATSCSQDNPQGADDQVQAGVVSDEQYMKAQQLVKKAQTHLAADQPDSASVQLAAAAQIFEDGSLIKEKISNQAKELEQARSASFRAEALGRLSAQGLKSLKSGDKTIYFADPSVNTYFLRQLKAHAGEWAKAHSELLQAQALNKKMRIAAEDLAEKQDVVDAQQQTEERRAYTQVLRNNFLDNNLDIKVNVSGKKATHLTLKYALFSAVWARKLQTGGFIAGSSLDQWHEMGFTKITLTDGYDYSASFTF